MPVAQSGAYKAQGQGGIAKIIIFTNCLHLCLNIPYVFKCEEIIRLNTESVES